MRKKRRAPGVPPTRPGPETATELHHGVRTARRAANILLATSWRARTARRSVSMFLATSWRALTARPTASMLFATPRRALTARPTFLRTLGKRPDRRGCRHAPFKERNGHKARGSRRAAPQLEPNKSTRCLFVPPKRVVFFSCCAFLPSRVSEPDPLSHDVAVKEDSRTAAA